MDGLHEELVLAAKGGRWKFMNEDLLKAPYLLEADRKPSTRTRESPGKSSTRTRESPVKMTNGHSILLQVLNV